MKSSILKNIYRNIQTLSSTNIKKTLNDYSNRIVALENYTAWQPRQIELKYHYLNILHYYAYHKERAKQYQKELDFLYEFGDFTNFPYKTNNSEKEIDSGVDFVSKLPYIIHNNKKLFFPASFSTDEAKKCYLYYVQTEKLLGINDISIAPHQYQSQRIQVSEKDIVFDIGAAEGLFALNNIDKASKLIIVENDPVWITPLKFTFAPYQDKVTIINKYISSTDTEKTMSLNTLLSGIEYNSAFIKMDIEGCEVPAISSALDYLKTKKNTKFAVASYHRQNDACELQKLFEMMGYQIEFSNGYMLFCLYDTPVPPYFRKGIIRATNINVKI